MVPPLAIFGIENDGVNLAINLLILFLIVVYLALIAYTYLDARRRLEDPVLVACATVAALFPFLGVIIYTILRPPEFLEDRRERDLEIRASELRVRQLEENSCPNCEHPVERTYLRCPSCRARIKDPCESCGKPVDPRWTLCPYCETPTRRKEPEPTSRRSSRRSAARPTRASRPVSRSSGGGEDEQRATPKRSSSSRTSSARASQPPPGRRAKPSE
jgi:hypothetical protein